MGLANLIPFVFIAVVSAIPVKNVPARTIYQDMINDPQTCPSLKNFLNRTYYVGTYCNFTVSSYLEPAVNQLICFGIYDMAMKICQATNKASDKYTVPDDLEKNINKTMEDKQVYADIVMNDGKYCKEIVHKIGNPYDQTKEYVDRLKQVFGNACVHECTTDYNKIANPLCVILHMMVDYEYPHHPISGENVDVAKVNAPPVVEKGQEAKKTTHKEKVEPKPKQIQVTKSEKVKEEEQSKVQEEKKFDKEKIPPKVETVPKVSAPQVTEPVEVKPKVTKVSTETMKNAEMVDNTGTGVESGNVGMGMGTYEESSKKDEEKKKDKVEEEIPKLEDNDKKPDDNRAGIEKPVGDDDYGDDGDDVQTKDENEKSDQNHLPRVDQAAEVEEDGSHAFLYFTMLSLGCIVLYVMYLSKQKILATIVRLRRSRNRGRRRPSTANYRKLDCTLEEAVTSQCNANVTHVIY